MDNIILIGMPGAGKSTIGVLLAKATGRTFLDTDLVIQHREGQLLQTLVDAAGVEGFLEIEGAAILTVEGTGMVIATGGSAVCHPGAMKHLQSLGKVIYLRVPFEELETRLSNISSRGIAMAPGQTLRDIFDHREPLYEAYADLTVDVTTQTLEETVTAVLKQIDEKRT